MNSQYPVVIGLDVGKTGHHACALDPDGSKLFDKPLPQHEAKLRELFMGLQKLGDVLMIVDQPNTIGALPIAVARDWGSRYARPQTSIPAGQRQTRATRSSSPTPPAPCPTRSDRSTVTAKSSPL